MYGRATYNAAVDFNGFSAGNSFKINVPTAAGGTGVDIWVLTTAADNNGSGSAGDNRISIGCSTGPSAGTVAETVVDAINGHYGSGGTYNHSFASANTFTATGVTATLSGSTAVTITASNTGTAGNDIRVYDVAGTLVAGDGDIDLVGGATPESLICNKISAAINFSTPGHLTLDHSWTTGNEFVTLTNTRTDAGTSRSIGATGNSDMVLTGADNSVFTTTGMSGGVDKCGDSVGTGGTFPCQDFTVTFHGAVSGFTGKVCNCDDECAECGDGHDACGENLEEDQCMVAGNYNEDMKPGDWYYVSEIGKLRNWKWHNTATSKVNDPIGLALTSDILMVMPYRANKT